MLPSLPPSAAQVSVLHATIQTLEPALLTQTFYQLFGVMEKVYGMAFVLVQFVSWHEILVISSKFPLISSNF